MVELTSDTPDGYDRYLLAKVREGLAALERGEVVRQEDLERIELQWHRGR